MTIKPESPPDRTVFVFGACLGIGVALAVLALLFLGLTVWTAALAVLLLACPLVIGWGLFITTRRRSRLPARGKPT